jgi:WASH complex subunit 7
MLHVCVCVAFSGEGYMQDGAAQLLVSRMLQHLQELSCFVKRCEQVVVQIVEQLAALYSSSKDAPCVINATGIHFQVWLHTHTHNVG